MRLVREKNIVYRIISVCLVFTLVFSSFAPTAALAARSRAGGGKISKPDWGNVAKNVGITVGTVVISSGLSSAWNTAAPVNQSAGFLGKLGTDIANIPTTIGNLLTNTVGNSKLIAQGITTTPWAAAFSSLTSLETVAPTMIKGYSIYTAGTQVSRMTGMMGSYYQWSPRTTFILSNIGLGMTAGFLNPQGALSETFSKTAPFTSQMAKGMLVAGFAGYATGATIFSIDGDKIKQGKSPGTGAQIAGMGAGMLATEFGRTVLNPATYNTAVKQVKLQPQSIKYAPDYEFGEGAYVAKNENGGLDPSNILTPEKLQELKDTPGVTIKGLGSGELEISGPALKDIERMAGVTTSFKPAVDKYDEVYAQKHPGQGLLKDQEASFETLKDLLGSDRASVSAGNDGNVRIVVAGGKENPPLEFNLTGEEYNFVSNAGPGLERDTYIMPTGQPPTGSQIAARILVDPFVKTLDQWPIIAARALSLNAYKKVASSEEHSKWAPLASEVVFSATVPLFESAANIWGLKPSLMFNMDKYLGYLPESKYQQQAFFKNAEIQRIAKATAKLPPDATDKQIKAMLAELKLAPEQDKILEEFKEVKNKIELQEQKVFDHKEQTRVLSNLIAGKINKRFSEEADAFKVFQGIGGSRPEVFWHSVWNTARYDLPLSLLSGSIQVGLNRGIKDDDFSGALSGVALSGLARGLAWNLYSQYSHALAIKGINDRKANPYQIAAELTLQEPAAIMVERLAGHLPPLDSREVVIAERLFSGSGEQGKNIKPEEVKSAIAALDLFLPGEEAPLSLDSQTSLEDIKKSFSDRLTRLNEDKEIQTKSAENALAWYLLKYKGFERLYSNFDSIKESVGVREVGEGEQGFTIAPNIELGPDDKGIIRTGWASPLNKLRVDTNTYFKPQDKNKKAMPVGDRLEVRQDLTIYQGQVNITGAATYNGQRGEVHYLPAVPGLSQTMMGSLSQGLFEFGWQSLAMGLPLTKEGKMGAYALSNYVWSSPQSVYNLTNAAASGGGFFKVMSQYATSIGKDVIERNILTTAADLPLVGSALGIAPYVAVKGYKGMPFSVVAQIETGFKAQDTAFYPYWPYQRMSVVPHEHFWRDLKIGMAKQITGQIIIPENNGNGTKIREK